LYDQPKTASEVADTVDTSLQNVNYHLNNLTDCNLIEVADTLYSDQGKEMKVYSPTSEALVLFASDDLQHAGN
jgi:predicted ArsR family transcriptional regulator